jgi:hypothetical protein
VSRAGSGKACRTRVVGYVYLAPHGFDETALEKVLEPARRAGVVTDYDTGRGTCFWFLGTPSARLRSVRRAALTIAGAQGPLSPQTYPARKRRR